MKMSERLVLAQWALLLALVVVLMLALRLPSTDNQAAPRFEVLLSTELDNMSVPLVTKTQLMQPPCMPPWSLRIEANRKTTDGESIYVLNVLLQGPEKTTKEDNEVLEKSRLCYREDSDTGTDHRFVSPSYSRPSIINSYDEAKHNGKDYGNANERYSMRFRIDDEQYATTADAGSSVLDPSEDEVQIQRPTDTLASTTPLTSPPPRKRNPPEREVRSEESIAAH